MSMPYTPVLCAPSDAVDPFGSGMRTQELITGLRKVNPRLNCPDPSVYRYIVEGAGTVGLYLGDPGNAERSYITALPIGIIPEFTQIDPHGRVMAKGWRAVLENVVKAGAAERGKLERLFGVSLQVDGRDSLCPTCRKGGKLVKGDGQSGLCRIHESARKVSIRRLR